MEPYYVALFVLAAAVAVRLHRSWQVREWWKLHFLSGFFCTYRHGRNWSVDDLDGHPLHKPAIA